MIDLLKLIASIIAVISVVAAITYFMYTVHMKSLLSIQNTIDVNDDYKSYGIVVFSLFVLGFFLYFSIRCNDGLGLVPFVLYAVTFWFNEHFFKEYTKIKKSIFSINSYTEKPDRSKYIDAFKSYSIFVLVILNVAAFGFDVYIHSTTVSIVLNNINPTIKDYLTVIEIITYTLFNYSISIFFLGLLNGLKLSYDFKKYMLTGSELINKKSIITCYLIGVTSEFYIVKPIESIELDSNNNEIKTELNHSITYISKSKVSYFSLI